MPQDAEDVPSALQQGLPLSQSQGLPFQGSGGGLAFTPRPPLAPVTLQSQPLGNNQPVGTLGGIGNVLQSFNAGIQNELAPWEKIQLAGQERALRQQALAQQQQMQDATVPHIQAQTQLLQGQLADLGFKTMQHAAMYLPSIPKDQQQGFLDSVRPMIQQQFRLGAQGDPAAQKIAGNGEFIDYIIKGGQAKAEAFLQSWPLLPANAKTIIAEQVIAGKPEEATKLAETLSSQFGQQIVSVLGQRVLALPRPPGNQMLTLQQAMTMAQATPQERAAVDHLLKTEKTEAVNAALDTLGIIPPSSRVKVQLTQAEELAKEATPGGQATIAEKQASTALKGEEAKKAGVVTIPGQGGGVATLPGTQAARLTAPQGQGLDTSSLAGKGDEYRARAAAESDPATKAIFLNAANAVDAVPKVTIPPQQAPMSGIQLAPGMTMLGQSPGPPMAPEAATKIATLEESVRTMKRVGTYANDRNLDAYIGPALTRPVGAVTEAIQKKTPFGGSVPPRVADLEQGVGLLVNNTIQRITGAAVNKVEEPRILKEIPDLKADKPAVFWQKYNQTLQTHQVLLDREKAMMGPDGRQRVDVDPDEVAKKYPLPKPLPDSVTGPQGSVRIKPGTSNATGR